MSTTYETGNAHQQSPSRVGQAKEAVAQTAGRTKETPSEHPISSAAVCFGLGFGAGLLIGLSLTGASRSRFTDRSLAERYGRHMMDAMAQLVPQSLGGHS